MATARTSLASRRRAGLDRTGWWLAALAAISAANAVWMLTDPAHWYHELPAAVPDTGPYNEHFVRDLGVAFATFAFGLAWAARRPRWRPPLTALAALFLAGHAAIHAFDTLRGALGHAHWWIDAPGVYVPAALAVALALHLLRAPEKEPT